MESLSQVFDPFVDLNDKIKLVSQTLFPYLLKENSSSSLEPESESAYAWVNAAGYGSLLSKLAPLHKIKDSAFVCEPSTKAETVTTTTAICERNDSVEVTKLIVNSHESIIEKRNKNDRISTEKLNLELGETEKLKQSALEKIKPIVEYKFLPDIDPSIVYSSVSIRQSQKNIKDVPVNGHSNKSSIFSASRFSHELQETESSFSPHSSKNDKDDIAHSVKIDPNSISTTAKIISKEDEEVDSSAVGDKSMEMKKKDTLKNIQNIIDWRPEPELPIEPPSNIAGSSSPTKNDLKNPKDLSKEGTYQSSYEKQVVNGKRRLVVKLVYTSP